MPIFSLARQQEKPWPRLRGARLREAIVVGVIVDFVLLASGVARHPAVLGASAGEAVVVGMLVVTLLAYWVAGTRMGSADDPVGEQVRRQGLTFGLLVGAVWTAQILLGSLFGSGNLANYLITMTAGGFVLLLYVAAGVRGGAERGSFRQGVSAAAWSGAVGALIAFGAALLGNYVFMDALKQNPLVVEGYARSGAGDLAVFTIQGTLGSGLSHLILGPAFGAASGALGGLVSKLQARAGGHP